MMRNNMVVKFFHISKILHFLGIKSEFYHSSTGRFTKLGMSLTDNEPSQALLMPILTCVAHIITPGNHQQKCPEMKNYFALSL